MRAAWDRVLKFYDSVFADVVRDVFMGLAVIMGVKLVQVVLGWFFGAGTTTAADFEKIHHIAGLFMYGLVSLLGIARLIERIAYRFISIRRVFQGQEPLND